MGTTPSAAKTFPALAKRMAFATPSKRSELPRRWSKCNAITAIAKIEKWLDSSTYCEPRHRVVPFGGGVLLRGQA